ncbi:AraC family transcriptional regulator [Bordetella trematum]|uniref:AraC family transcriptional regulator n=3 Tax=Bordetella trematum TaxID=123899 RepID=UPI0012697118|nr:AraC family transcriptional regulator [Bordetella trematum]
MVIPHRHFQSCALPRDARFDIWRDRMGAMFDIDTLDGNRELRIDVRSFHLGSMIFSNMDVTPFVFERSARKARSDMLDHVMLRFDPPAAAGKPPRMLTIDLAQPLERMPISARNLSVILPRASASALIAAPHKWHGQFVEGAGITLLCDYLKALSRSISSIGPEQAPDIFTATSHLISACVGTLQGDPLKTRSLASGTALMRVRRYIESRLADPGLDPADIATQCAVSRSSLYRLFSSHGGVAGYIQERRLLRAFARLSSLQPSSTIAMVAHQCGFSSEAHFSRRFRHRFGCSPSELRAGARAGVGGATDSPVAQILADNAFKTWVSGLSA